MGPFRRLCCRLHVPACTRRGRRHARARGASPVRTAVSAGQPEQAFAESGGVRREWGRSPGVGWPDAWAPTVLPVRTADAHTGVGLLGALGPQRDTQTPRGPVTSAPHTEPQGIRVRSSPRGRR